MQRRSSSVNVSLEEGSHRDTGVLELVPDPHTGKRGFRRVFPGMMNNVQPDPDMQSTVHPANGDAPDAADPVRRRPSIAVRTQNQPQQTQAPRLPRQETTSTIHSTTQKPPPRRNVMRALRDSFLWRNEHEQQRVVHERPAPLDVASPLSSGLPYANGSIQALGTAWKGKEKEVAANLFQDNEGDKLSVVMDDARRNRLAAKAREIREWMKGRSMHRPTNTHTNTHASTNTNTNTNTNVNGNGNGNANANANAHHDKANGGTNGHAIPNNNNSTRRKPAPTNTGGSGMRDLFKGRRQNTSNNPAAGQATRQTSNGPTPKPAAPTPAPPHKDRGPRPGQTYEILERRIIENNPERTVEISTWREQVPPVKKNSSDQEDKISIYYISADEYPEEDRPMAKVEWRVDGGEMPPGSMDFSMGGSANRLGPGGANGRPRHSRHGSSYHSTRPESKRHHSYNGHISDNSTAKKPGNHDSTPKANGKRHHHPPNGHATSNTDAGANRVASPITSSRTREGTISPSSSEREREPSSVLTEKIHVPQQQQHSGSKFVENINSGSTSPAPVQTSQSASAVPARSLRHTGRRELFPTESTPIATVGPSPPAPLVNGAAQSNLAPPPPSITVNGGARTVSAPEPFTAIHDSGSTISSIKSVGAVQFEAVLQSCEPSLMHIAPALRQLGIRHLEHLRAVGKLTPATRDREVKEGALRLGVTVVEWAILLDRILTLL